MFLAFIWIEYCNQFFKVTNYVKLFNFNSQ